MFGGGNFGASNFGSGQVSQQGAPQAMTNPMGSAMNIQEVSVAQGSGQGQVQFVSPARPSVGRNRDKSGRRTPAGVVANPSWPWSGPDQK